MKGANENAPIGNGDSPALRIRKAGIPKHAFSYRDGVPLPNCPPARSVPGSMAFIVYAPNRFRRMTDARPTRPSPCGRASRGLDRTLSAALVLKITR